MHILKSLALAAVLSGTSVSADTLYRDSFNHNTLGGSGTYNSGGYTQRNDHDLNRNSLYDATLQDSNGNLYDCNSLGSCSSRY